MKKIRILATTDVHGSVLSHSYIDSSSINSGLSRISSAIKHYRNEELIVIDNGDVLQGTPLVSYNHRFQEHSLYSKALNALEYDYYNLGNHDFNYGQEILKRFMRETKATNICGNILIDNQPVGHSIVHQTTSNHKLGIIGVVTDYIANWEQPANLIGITIESVKEVVQKSIDELRDKVDSIVVVYHGGFERDFVTGEPTELLLGENIGYELTTLKGIDVLISGHQHRSFVETINGVLCLQCANSAKEFMLIEYDDGWSGQLIQSSDFEVDAEFEALFEEEEALTQNWLDTVIGEGPDMRIENVLEAQIHKSPYVSFVNQVALSRFKADFSFSCLFNTSPGLKPIITMRDLVASYPFPNTWVVIEIDLPTLKEYLEKNASYFTLNNHKIDISPENNVPKLEMYNYDMGDGLSYTIDVSLPVGQRVTITKIANKELFTMVINNYRATGGGKFFMVRDCRKLVEDSTEVLDLLYDYVVENQPLVVKHEENIRVNR